MKKLFSMLLALTMVMSLFCTVSVSAAEFTLPYVNFDFNDIEQCESNYYGDDVAVWNSAAYVDGVAGGKALYIESAGTSGGSYLSFSFDNGTPAVMASGEQFKISFWLKLNTEISKFASDTNPSTLQLCYTAKGGSKGYKAYNFDAQTAALNAGDWVYYEETFGGWDGQNNVNGGKYNTVTNPENVDLRMTFRLGYTNGTAPAALMDSVKNKYALAIDDFRIEPVAKTPFNPDNVVEEEYVPKTVLDYKFNASDVANGVGHWNCQSGTKAVQSSGGADGGKYTKVTWTGIAAGSWRDLNWTHNQEMDHNKLTKITFWAKAEDANTAGTQLRWRLYQKMNNVTAPIKLELDANINKTDIFPDDYWYIEIGSLTTSWQEYTVYLKNNAKTFDESKYRIALQVKNPNVGFSLGIDNMTITQEEIPTNAEFENLAYPVTKTVKSDGTVLANEQSKKYAANLYGWLADDATVTADTTAPHGGSQAAKVVTTAENGSIYQGIYLENNKTHEISFWAKGEGDSIGKNISVILDRAVETKSQYDIYPVEDTVTLTPTDAVLTADWKKFTVNYELNSVLPEGTTMPTINANQEIGVRQPFLKFAVDGGASGMTYYLDDLKIQAPKAGHADPYVIDYSAYESDGVTAAMPVESKTLIAKYKAVSELLNDSIKAVVTRVMIESKAGSGKYGTYQTIVDTANEGKVEFVVPENCIGRKIKLSIQPFTANGVSGAFYEKEIGTIAKQYEVSMTVGEYNASSSSITTTYSVVNNKVDNSDVRAIMATIFYSENGTMVKYMTNPVVVANGSSVTNATFTATSTLSDLSLPAAAKAKVFFWFAEEPEEGSVAEEPSVFNTSMVEVVPSVTVDFN